MKDIKLNLLSDVLSCQYEVSSKKLDSSYAGIRTAVCTIAQAIGRVSGDKKAAEQFVRDCGMYIDAEVERWIDIGVSSKMN